MVAIYKRAKNILRHTYLQKHKGFITCLSHCVLSLSLDYTDINYLFGHYSGILLASTFYFVVYCLLMKNRPRVYPKAILPGLLSGIMWGIAMGQSVEPQTYDELLAILQV